MPPRQPVCAVPGVVGLNACYAPSVRGQGGQTRTRGLQHDPGSPTDVQAEVLVTRTGADVGNLCAIVFPAEDAAVRGVRAAGPIRLAPARRHPVGDFAGYVR